MTQKEKHGPSSVTLDETVAKLIEFKWIPEGVSLEEFLEALLSDTRDECFELQRLSPTDAGVREKWEEYRQCEVLLSEARRLLQDLESCLQSEDPLLKLAITDASKTRLTTLSVAEWALERHQIEIPEWLVYRGENEENPCKLDHEKYEGELLFRAIASLTNELLSRDWVDWKGEQPFRARPLTHKYFANGRPKIERFKVPFLQTFNKEDGNDKGWRTVGKRLKDAISYLEGKTKIKPVAKRERPHAYTTLIGLTRMLSRNSQGKALHQYVDANTETSEISKLVDSFRYTSKYIRPEELIKCIDLAKSNFKK